MVNAKSPTFDEVKLNKHIFKTKENLIYHLQHKHNTTINIDEIKKYDEKINMWLLTLEDYSNLLQLTRY